MTDRQTDRRYDLDILRILLTILVVLGHASYYTINTKFGGIHYDQILSDMMIQDAGVHKATSLLTEWIYSFHMPAYFCLSGAVFSLELKKNRYSSVSKLIREKAKRLLIPLLFVWFVWNIPIKMLAGYYDGLAHPLMMAVIQIIFPNAVYLWFLEALFFCFIMDYVIEKHIKNVGQQFIIVGTLALIGLGFYKYARQIVPFGNPFRWLIWFWTGHFIDDILNELSKTSKNHGFKSKKRAFVAESFLFALLYEISFCTASVKWILINTVMPFVGIIWIWTFARIIESALKEEHHKKLLAISQNTYGVYLWAEPLNYLVLSCAMKWFGISVFGTEMGAALIYIVRVVGTVAISVLITNVLRKIRCPIKAY